MAISDILKPEDYENHLGANLGALQDELVNFKARTYETAVNDLVWDEFENLGFDKTYIYTHREEFRVDVYPSVNGHASMAFYHHEKLLFTLHEYLRIEQKEGDGALGAYLVAKAYIYKEEN